MALKITLKFKIKPAKGQSKKEAEAEFLRIFRGHLTDKEGSFQSDYGLDAWGGYEGPFVKDVSVRGPGDPK